MAIIEIHDPEPEFSVKRETDQYGSVVFTLHAGGEYVNVNVGNTQEDVDSLAEALEDLAREIRDDILDGWVNTPDEEDGYVGVDRYGYYAQLSRKSIDSPWTYGRNRNVFPTREIAVYALAEASANAEYFPNMWYQDERGYQEQINAEIYALQDDTSEPGKTLMNPLAGVIYKEGERVDIDGGWPYVVDRDYGSNLGVMLHCDGDPSMIEHVMHESIKPYDDEEEDSED